jgi:hypothetical protein
MLALMCKRQLHKRARLTRTLCYSAVTKAYAASSADGQEPWLVVWNSGELLHELLLLRKFASRHVMTQCLQR